MAVTATVANKEVPGGSFVGIFEVQFTGSTDYVTNGVSPVAAILAAGKMSRIEDISPVAIGPSLAAGIFAYSWDAANRLLKLYTSAANECANALDISSIKAYFYVKGR